MFMGPKSLFYDGKASSCRLQALTGFRGADLRASRTQHDLFQPAFGGFQLFLAMALQGLSAFVQGDGILKVHLALLKAGNNGFQLLERAFEAQFFDVLASPF
jgi:hypothetical protein